ncbi:unnamed protein product, partial [Brassica oleracea]
HAADWNREYELLGKAIDQREGAKEDEITEDMIANSKTLAFNLEKYLLKKQKKYAPKVLFLLFLFVVYVFVSIYEAYLKKYPARIKRAPFLAERIWLVVLSLVDMVGGLATESLFFVCFVFFREQDDYENSNEMCVIKMLKPVKKKKVSLLHYL